MASYTLTRRQKAAAQIIRENARGRSWLVFLETGNTLASWLCWVIVAWFTSPLVLLPVFVVMYVAAFFRMKSLLLPLWHPILLLLPGRYSGFGLHRKQLSPLRFRLLSGLLRGLGLVALGTLPWWHTGVPWMCLGGLNPENTPEDCAQVPAWLREGCNNEDFDAGRFQYCQTESWYFPGACGLWASRCCGPFVDPVAALTLFADTVDPMAAARPQLARHENWEEDNTRYFQLGWYIVPGLCWLVSTGLQLLPSIKLAKKVRASPALREDLPEPTAWDRLKVHKLFGLLLVDILSDLNCIVTFVRNQHYLFGVFALLVLVASSVQQLRQSGPKVLWAEYKESLSAGYPTDRFLAFSFTEKSVEAPLSLLLQFYTFPFVTGDLWALCTFSFSMLLSLYSITDAAYALFHLDMFDELVKLSLPESE